MALDRTFYRVVASKSPVVTDFLSRSALGRPSLTADRSLQRLAAGISVFSTLQQARRNARSFSEHGQFIVELSIPEGSAMSFERTGRQDGHHTMWGDPKQFLDCVVSVVPV